MLAIPKSLPLAKALDERVILLQQAQAKAIRRQFMRFVEALTTGMQLDRITTLIGKNNIEGVLRTVDFHVEKFSNVLANVFAQVANKEADHLATKLLAKAHNINMADPRILRLIQNNRQLMVQNLTRQQREVVRLSIIEGMRLGESPAQIARRFARTVGLTNQQREAIKSYQRALERGSAEALNRAAHDPRFTELAETRFAESSVLTVNQIERMVGAYTRNLRLIRARSIAETEGLRMLNQARNIAVRQAAEATGVVPTKTWLHTSSAEPRESHLQIVGETISIDEAFVSPSGARMMFPGDTSLGAGPGDIVNCFPGNVVVNGNISAAMRSKYEGPLIKITTTAGYQLSGTPNHPVLTDRGWVPLHELTESDCIFSCVRTNSPIPSPNVNNRNISIEKIFNTFSMVGATKRIAFNKVDFHGDRPTQDIDIVFAYRRLSNRVKAKFLEYLTQLTLALSNSASRLLPCSSTLYQSLVGLFTPSRSYVSAICQYSPLNNRELRHSQYRGFMPVPRFNTSVIQTGDNKTPILANILGNMLNRQTRLKLINNFILELHSALFTPETTTNYLRSKYTQWLKMVIKGHGTNTNLECYDFDTKLQLGVQMDRVIQIEKSSFVGHVYTLETKEGMYIANNIIVRNCKCGIEYNMGE